MSAVVQTVVAYQDAWTSRNYDKARQFVADDVVFRSSGGQYITGIDAFFAMLSAFGERIKPTWENVAILEDVHGVLVIYKLFTAAGSPAFCADYFVVRDAKIQSDTLVFDPVPFARPPQ